MLPEIKMKSLFLWTQSTQDNTMKNIQNLAMLSAVIAFASCNSNKTEPQAEELKTETAMPAADTTNRVATEANPAVAGDEAKQIKVVEGTVKQIINGKDGYTAAILTKDNMTYQVTISHSNLTNHEQYRTFNLNEIVKVSGDYWETGAEKHITVREIQ